MKQLNTVLLWLGLLASLVFLTLSSSSHLKTVSVGKFWASVITFTLLGLISLAIYLDGTFRLPSQRKRNALTVLAEHERREEGPIPRVLIEACQRGDCVLYAGSGLSAQAGLPAWSVFVTQLAQWAGDSAGGDADSVMDRIVAAYRNRRQDLYDYLRSQLRVTSEISRSHRLIKEIDFSAVITTNLDNLLDRALPCSGGRVYTAANCAGLVHAAERRDFFLLKPFGDLGEPGTLSLGTAQCLQTMRDNRSLRELLEGLLHSNTFLFLGVSIEGLERDLTALAVEPQTERRHFILLPDIGESWKAPAERMRLRYGIEALTYVPSTPDHPEVPEFLANLIAAMRATRATDQYFVAEKS
jgi:SIR2-like protein